MLEPLFISISIVVQVKTLEIGVFATSERKNLVLAGTIPGYYYRNLMRKISGKFRCALVFLAATLRSLHTLGVAG